MPDEPSSLRHGLYPYECCADQDAAEAPRHPVIVVGGGPVGLAAALDLGLAGVPAVVLDDQEGVGEGSRAICFAKRTLEIADRLGCAGPMVGKGVVWSRGKVFHRDRMVYEFDLLPEEGHALPAFVNLPQSLFEMHLVERVRQARAAGAPIEIRGANRVEGIEAGRDGAALDVATPEGPYRVAADWVVACDGAGSPLRAMMGLDFEGRAFRDSFLIADIRMEADLPAERRFWFEPAHGAGASTLVHRQPDNVWRVDFQVGPDADRGEELKEENVRRRLDAMLGDAARYEIVWTSLYRFHCRRMERFRHGRVLFAGDAAHQVSPFGARGANSGIQDADNLGWKLRMAIRGEAPERLLDSYCAERRFAADENIAHSTRSTDFISPKSPISHAMRNAVLALAERHGFARAMVNSGRLSTPAVLDDSPLNSDDALAGGPAISRPGAACPDAPVGDGFLLGRLGGGFAVLAIGTDAPERITAGGVAADRVAVSPAEDPTGALAQRYLGAAASAVYLIRPDQHVAGRWAAFDEEALRRALLRACAKE